MESKIQESIIDLFSVFEEFHLSTNGIFKRCKRIASDIENYVKRYNCIISATIKNTPLSEFENLKEKLLKELNFIISEQIKLIKEHYCTLKNIQDHLKRKHNIFKNNCKGINLNSESKLEQGSSLQPPLYQILEYSENTLQYANYITYKFEPIINNSSNLEIISDLFTIDKNIKKEVDEIVAISEFFKENDILQ